MTPPQGFSDGFNFIYQEGGNLRLRAGFKKLNASSLNAPITGLKQVPWNVSALLTVCAAGTGIYIWNEALDTFITIWNTQTSEAKTVFDAYGGNLLFANGLDSMRYYNGSVCQEVIPPLEGWYSGLNPEMVIIWKDSAWVAVGPMVYKSNLQVPYDFLNGSSTQFPTGDDNPVRCLIEAFDKLWVVKDRSVGYITQTKVANLDGSIYYGWTYTKAYSSVFGTPSNFGACGYGESAYYGAPDGLFEITNTGREGIGNFNTQRLEVLGIGNYFDPAHTDHLFFNSFEKLIVVPHLGRNEVWFFVGRLSNNIDTILVYCRALKRWTQFTVPVCQAACPYVTESYQRVVAIGTDDGFVAISDQAFDGKDLGMDYVGNSYLDFMWSGDSPISTQYSQGIAAEFFKSWRLFSPTIQGAQFKYSTYFDEARPGVSNVPVAVGTGVDQIAHEVPLELNGKGTWLKTRISGSAGNWPLEIAGIVVGSKIVRQRRLSTITPLGTWTLPTTTDFTKPFYCVADWTQSFGLLRFYAGNNSLIVQMGNFLIEDMIVNNSITLGAERGGGFVKHIIGIYLATETFQANDPWALPTNPTTINYYTGGAFVNNPAVYTTTITLGTALATGTNVIVRYLYEMPDVKTPSYASMMNYPWIQKVDANSLVPSMSFKGLPDFTLCNQWENKKLFPLNAAAANAAIKFLWKLLLNTMAANVLNYGPLVSFSTTISGLLGPIGSSPTAANVLLLTSFQAGLATVPAAVVANPNAMAQLPIADNVAMTTQFQSLTDTLNYGLSISINIVTTNYGAYVGIKLNWPTLVTQQIDAISFEYQGNQSGQAILCSLVAENGNVYFAGFPDISSNKLTLGIHLTQFYRLSTLFWDGIRVVNFVTLSYYSASGSKAPIVREVLDSAFFSPEGDLLHSFIELQDTTQVASWIQALIDTSAVSYPVTTAQGLCFLYKCASGPSAPTILVTVVSTGGGTKTFSFTGVPNNKWIRQSILWGEFTPNAPSGNITSITVRSTPCTGLQLADFCFCDAVRLPYKLRYSDLFENIDSLVWSVQDNAGYKTYYLYDTIVTYTYYTPGWGTIGRGETLKPIAHQGTYVQVLSAPTSTVDSGALGQVSMEITKLAIALKTSNAFPYTWPSLIAYLPGQSEGLFSGGVLACYAPLLAAWIAQELNDPTLEKMNKSLASRRNLIIQGAAAYKARYNIDGPIVPANSCVATEALGLFRGFNTFDWYRKWPNAELALYHFNGNLNDASLEGQDLAWSSDSQGYTTGLSFPSNINTAIAFTSARWATGASSLVLGQNFSIMLLIKGGTPAGNNLIVAQKYAGSGYGWKITTGLIGETKLILTTISSLGTVNLEIDHVLDGAWHLVVWTITAGQCLGYLDNAGVLSTGDIVGNINNTTDLNVGRSAEVTIDIFGIEAKVIPADQIRMMWVAFQGDPNQMALIPAASTGIGQYLAFLNTAKYRWISSDVSVDSYLDNFVTWLDANIKDLGGGLYQPPQYFNQYGYSYGTEVNPEYHGLILQGLIYYYWYSGSATAAMWITRLMDDLRVNLTDPTTQLYLSRG
jgi:hypothetical protein